MPVLEGIFPPLPTPFTEAGALALDRLRENVEALNGTGIAGFLALGSNGEAVHLDDDEAGSVFACVRRQAAPGSVVLAGTGRPSTRDTIALTRRAAEAGCDAALVVTPSYYRNAMTNDALRRHYQSVADASPIPVLLYNVPANTGLNLPPEVAADLAAHPNIIGIKDSAGDVSQLADLVSRTRTAGFAVGCGSFGALLPAASFGVKGAVLAVANVAPRECSAMLAHALAGRREEAAELHLRLLPVARAVTSRWSVPGVKAALDLLGRYGGPPRPPLLPLPAEPRGELRRLLAEAGLL